MLKIKDNVDLKELEKFGFNDMSKYNISEELEDDNNIWDYEEILYYSYFGSGGRRGQTYYLYVDKKRRLFINSTSPDGSGCKTDLDSNVYDLIKADLVEKVEEVSNE